jgi:hypothetical protein
MMDELYDLDRKFEYENGFTLQPIRLVLVK